eukprot:6179231-Prymnesium_polylepis.1
MSANAKLIGAGAIVGLAAGLSFTQLANDYTFQRLASSPSSSLVVLVVVVSAFCWHNFVRAPSEHASALAHDSAASSKAMASPGYVPPVLPVVSGVVEPAAGEKKKANDEETTLSFTINGVEQRIANPDPSLVVRRPPAARGGRPREGARGRGRAP